MTVASFSNNAKLKIRRAENKVKIKPLHYAENVLSPIFIEEILFVYPNDFQKVILHQDKATGHTSNTTYAFLEKKEESHRYRINTFSKFSCKVNLYFIYKLFSL